MAENEIWRKTGVGERNFFRAKRLVVTERCGHNDIYVNKNISMGVLFEKE